MREVQTHHVHARVQPFAYHLFGFGFSTDSTNNFRLFLMTVLVFKLRRIWNSLRRTARLSLLLKVMMPRSGR